MFNYSDLQISNKFYIEFDKPIDCYLVEDLIRYWYRQWFKKYTEVTIFWVNLNSFLVKDLVEVIIDLSNCSSKNYVIKDFINADKSLDTLGDRRRSLRRVLTEGVNTSNCKLNNINTEVIILNEYKQKLDIPNPYLLNNFNINNVNYIELVELINKLIDKEDKQLTQLTCELDTNTKYNCMKKQLYKLEKLQEILELVNELKEL